MSLSGLCTGFPGTYPAISGVSGLSPLGTSSLLSPNLGWSRFGGTSSGSGLTTSSLSCFSAPAPLVKPFATPAPSSLVPSVCGSISVSVPVVAGNPSPVVSVSRLGQDTCGGLEEELNRLRSSLATSRQNEASLCAKLHSASGRQAQSGDLQVKVNQLGSQLRDAEQRLANFVGKHSSTEHTVSELTARLRAAEERSLQLQAALEMERRKARESVCVERQLVTVASERDEARRQAALMEVRVMGSETRASQLHDGEACILRTTLAEERQRMFQLESQRNEAQRQIALLETQLQAANGRNSKVQEGELFRLRKDLVDSQQRVFAAEAQRDEAAKQIALLEMRYKAVEERFGQMQRGELAQMRLQANADQQRLQAMEMERGELQKQVAFLEMRLKGAEDRVAQVQQALEQERAALRQQVAEEQQRRQAAECQREETHQQLLELERRAQEVQMGELAHLRAQLQEAQQRIFGVEGQRDDAHQQLSTLELRLCSAEERLSQTQQAFDAERGRLVAQLQDEQTRRNAAEMQRAEYQNQVGFLEIKVSSTEERLVRVQEELQGVRQRFSEAQQRLTLTERQRDEAQEQVRAFETHLQALDQRVAQMKTAFESERAQLRAEVNSLTQCLATAEAKRDDAAKQASYLEMQMKSAIDRLTAGHEQQLAQLKTSFEAERGNFRAEVSAIQQRLTAAEARRDEAVKQVSYLEMQMKATGERQAMASEQQIAQLRSAFESERAQFREQLTALQQRLQGAEAARQECGTKVGFLEAQLSGANERLAKANEYIHQLELKIRQLESEVSSLRTRLEVKTEIHSQTNTKETYKVKTFDMAAKLAKMDGTDDGLYNGLPIEVEGQGLYRDMVRMGNQ